MHKLIDYVCTELEKIEDQVSASGKLSIAEVEYADKLAHLKKNLLKSDELMDQGYSGDMRRFPRQGRGIAFDGRGRSYDSEGRGTAYDNRGRGSQANRDSRGRYASDYSARYIRDDYSMNKDEIVMDLRDLMDKAPDERMRKEIHRIIEKAEDMDV